MTDMAVKLALASLTGSGGLECPCGELKKKKKLRG